MPKIKTKIVPHSYIGVDGTIQLYLHATANRQRIRLPLKIYVDPTQRDSAAQKNLPGESL